jgi:hypothetical protein
MSWLAGHNVVFQLRRDKLLYLIQENVTLQGNPLNQPFRLVVEGPPPGPFTARLRTVDLIVKSFDLTLHSGTRFCDLKLSLVGGVIRLNTAPEAPFLGGEVNVRIEMINGLLLTARLLEVTLKAPSTAVIDSIPAFAARANAEVNKVLGDARGRDIKLLPDSPLTMPFVFLGRNEHLDGETYCAWVGGGGERGDLTPSVGPHHSVAFAIEAPRIIDGISRSILTAKELGPGPPPGFFDPLSSDHIAKIPPPRGTGELYRGREGVDVWITGLGVSLRNGYIDVNGDFKASDGDCWVTRGGRFSQKIYLDFMGGRIIPRMEPLNPQLTYRLHIYFYCLVGLAFLNVVVNGLWPVIGISLTNSVMSLDQVPVPESPSVAPISPAALERIVWTDVAVSPEGLLLLGDRPSMVITPVPTPVGYIRTTHEPQGLHARGAGPVTVQAPTCAPEEFVYVQWAQDDMYTLTAESEWLVGPLDYEWTVNAHIISPAGVGVLNYEGTVRTAVPPPDGIEIIGHSIQLRYESSTGGTRLPVKGSNKTLTLNARKEDRNYDIRVELRVTDALGRVFHHVANIRMIGDIARFGADYDEYMSRCLMSAIDIANKKARWKVRLKPGEPQERVRDLLDVIAQQIRQGDLDAASTIPSLLAAFGVEPVNMALAGKRLDKQSS